MLQCKLSMRGIVEPGYASLTRGGVMIDEMVLVLPSAMSIWICCSGWEKAQQIGRIRLRSQRAARRLEARPRTDHSRESACTAACMRYRRGIGGDWI